MTTTCPICDKGILVERQDHQTIQYRGFGLNIPMVFSHCNQCESNQATDQQVLKNKQTCMAMKASVEMHIHQSMAATL